MTSSATFILAPIIGVRRKPKEEAEKDLTKQNKAVLVGFRAAYVFDVNHCDIAVTGSRLPFRSLRSIAISQRQSRGRNGFTNLYAICFVPFVRNLLQVLL